MAGPRLIFAVVRGDHEVNETKLANAVGAPELRPANAEDLAAAGIVAGYASPIGVHGATVVVDDLVTRSANLVAGANKPGYHLLNTNVPRDYQPAIVADIAAAYEGAPCPRCGQPVRMVRGVEVGNTFKLGTRYSKALGATFQDEDGRLQDIVMGCYGIGVGRLIACIAEASRDERGLIWPPAVAPFHVYLVGLDLERDEGFVTQAGAPPRRVQDVAEQLYHDLEGAGVEVLYDDRDERAGVKFNDADLLGIPLRVTVSRRTLQDGAVELKARTDAAGTRVALSDAVPAIREKWRVISG
jgi:prolyl-tRNA synthetase